MKNQMRKENKGKEFSDFSEIMTQRKNSLTCFDKVYGEGIFEKVKLHAEYT